MADTTQGNGGGGFWQAVIGAGAAGVNAVTKGGPKRQYKYNKKLAKYQNDLNRANQQWLLGQQKEMTAEQLKYDSPAEQMKRYQDAGLNKNLIYGNGSPGNMGTPTSAGSLPGVNVGQVDAGSLGNLGTEALQGAMMASQVDLTQAKTLESETRTELIGVQKAVAASNPMLDPRVAKGVSDSMLALAEAKAQEGKWMTSTHQDNSTNGQKRMAADLQNLFNRNFLQGASINSSAADLAIKNEILQSKEFDNALKEIQVKWMKDGEMTPQHMYQGLLMILGKMMK